jgi:CheY-like chemotaxis protein
MGKKILLADDSLTIQKVVELTFSDSDYELVCVSNGQKALERVREQRPDLILADVVMPEKNGYEVCEAIKGNPATSRIPVVLLSGTFEPFDRERAERIGADAIVSKPFDSQQLLGQVEALLDRVPAAAAETAAPAPTTARIPTVAESGPEELSHEEAPFDTGFSAEDFTASIRAPARHENLDPFEEEYGKVDVDSAIEAFEKAKPPVSAGAQSTGSGEAAARAQDAAREPLAQWLREEPDRPAASPPDLESATTVVLQKPDQSESYSEEEAATVAMKLPNSTMASGDGGRDASVTSPEEISEEQAKSLFDLAPPPPPLFVGEEALPPPAESAPSRSGTTAEVPREIEELAQTSSIPELTQMLSSVARPGGNDLTEEQIERLATRVVEKLSERILREIAWEVIPDMAEIVIKQRIKELEAGVE